MQSVPITTKVVTLNPVHGEVCLIQHHVIKFVSDLRQISGFLQVLWFPPPIKLTARYTEITEILLKVTLNIKHHKPNHTIVERFIIV
jgi:hypothetical protein